MYERLSLAESFLLSQNLTAAPATLLLSKRACFRIPTQYDKQDRMTANEPGTRTLTASHIPRTPQNTASEWNVQALLYTSLEEEPRMNLRDALGIRRSTALAPLLTLASASTPAT